jgi:hypothetical protein
MIRIIPPRGLVMTPRSLFDGLVVCGAGAFAAALTVASCGDSSGNQLFGGDPGAGDASVGGAGGQGGADASAGSAGTAAGHGGSAGATAGGGAGKGGTGGAGTGGSNAGGTAGTAGSGGAYVVCSSTYDCQQKLGSDACKVNLTCDAATAVCLWSALDQDKDGQPPKLCGGFDCNDADPMVHPGMAEQCDGKDNDCDGLTDNGTLCSGLLQCINGSCSCPSANACGAECVDKSSSNQHCGQCYHPCSTGSTCVAGTCQCGAGATLCGSSCVNLDSDPNHCGACSASCAPGYTCSNKTCMCTKTPCSGACVDVGTDPANCGTCGHTCPSGAACQGGSCACYGGLTLCSNSCVDTKTSQQHCGACNVACSGTCQNGACLTCVQSDLYLLLDTSGSMAPPDGGSAGALDYARQGINTFLQQAATAGMGIGLGYFAKPMTTTPSTCSTGDDCGCGGSCFINMCFGTGDLGAVSDYATADAPIAIMPGNATAISNVMSPLAAGGGTPPASLQGALQYAKGFAQSHAGHKLAVVLIADGLPNECTNNSGTATDWLPSVSAAAAGTPPVLTYVISMGDSSTTAAFNSVAASGGTGSARFATTSNGVRIALEQIRAAFKTCP